MATSLYDLTVPTYLQTVGAVAAYLDRGLSHCSDNGIDPESIVDTRLFPDMLPFRFQIQSVAHHSLGTLEGMKTGVFSPPGGSEPHDYKGLQALVAQTLDSLKAFTPEAINAFEGKDMAFDFRGFKMPFTTEGFVLSFSLPNVHFHATTAYDILRMKGVPLGKRDYMGALRMKA
jgi:hypothetical protein